MNCLNPIKIIFFTPSLDIGGIEKVFITYANHMCNNDNYEITYAYCKEHGLLEVQLSNKIKKYSLGNIKLLKSLIPLIKMLWKIKPDYIITGGDIPNILCVIASFFIKHTKCIISHHNFQNIEQKYNHLGSLLSYIYNRAYIVISVSKGITEYLHSIGVNKNKIRTIYNPLNIRDIQIKSRKNINIQINNDYLIYVGRLSVVKNLTMMLDSFKIIKKKYSELKLVIVGDGSEKDVLVQKMNQLQLSHDVIFTGALSNPFPLMLNAKAVLLSSLSEALPTVILESFALGKTVISTPTNGAVDLLSDGKYGYLSASINSEIDFAEAVFTALSSNIDKRLLKEHALSFSSASKANELCNLL